MKKKKSCEKEVEHLEVTDLLDEFEAEKEAEKIEKEIVHMSHSIFYIITKNPEKEHIAYDVKPSTMEKHKGHQRKQCPFNDTVMKVGRVEEPERNYPITKNKSCEEGAKRYFIKKDCYVQHYQ